MIKAIIFDCFGVIRIDPFDVAYKRFGGDIEKDIDFIKEIMYASNSGKIPSSEPVYAKHLGISTEVWRKAISDGSGLDMDVLDYTKELRKKYKIGLLSNIGSGGFKRLFEPGLLDKYFDVSVASGDVGYAKPEAQAYEITTDKLGVRLDESVFIDDRQEYVDGATAVGMQAILFTSLVQLKKDLSVIL